MYRITDTSNKKFYVLHIEDQHHLFHINGVMGKLLKRLGFLNNEYIWIGDQKLMNKLFRFYYFPRSTSKYVNIITEMKNIKTFDGVRDLIWIVNVSEEFGGENVHN